ncbi:hypothetical protein WJX75_002585 [Coccomyxa subellipsoidea]|uniref:Uncharacterized protein n=1 Tax=Coccomyxa subellipsoidea TaxID=248742 RepID=A0ABR2YEW3_9CHLO
MGNSASQIARRQYPTKGALNLSKELPVKSGASELANGQGSNVLQGLANSDLDDDEQKDLDFGKRRMALTDTGQQSKVDV